MVNFTFQRTGTPVWFTRAMDALLKALNSGPAILVPVLAADINTLYPAGSFKGSQVLVTDLDRVAVSNGTDWLRTDTGAVI